MKIKLYILAEGTDTGTRASVFISEEKRDERLKEIMKEAAEGDDYLRQLIEAKNISEAWDYWLENHVGYLDTYHLDEPEIEVEAKVVVEVSGGVAGITYCTPGVAAQLIDHDNEPAAHTI